MGESTAVTIRGMQTDIQYIKESQHSMSCKLDKFIDSCETKFATKEDHKANKVEIELIKSTHSKVISWLIGTVGTLFLAFLGLLAKATIFKG